MRTRPAALALFLAACGGGNAHDAAVVDPNGVVDAVPIADTAPASFCTPHAGTALKLTSFASGLERPVLVTAPAGDARVFIVEQPGRIRVVENGQLLATPFLDLENDVTSVADEQGLLGLAFHPDFVHNGRFFVRYSRAADGNGTIAEYHASPTADVADPGGTVLLSEDQPASNHNGGMIAFGADGDLYASFGDGGGGGDTYHNGQNKQTLHAKVLRIDIDHGAPYQIPSTNPWATGGGSPEMYVWGLRNPWRFSIDLPTGDLYIGDVGQGQFEEIDVVPHGTSGQNFGWPIYEGNTCFGAATCTAPENYTPPTLAYDRRNNGECAVMGGIVYRGTCMPDYVGTYFYGDYCAGEVNSFVYANGQATQPQSHTVDLDPTHLLQGRLTSFGADGFGEMYVTALQAGIVYRVELE